VRARAQIIRAGEGAGGADDNRTGAEWRVGSIAGEPGQSLGVHLAGDKAGVWRDFAAGGAHQGDALDLVAQVRFGGNKSQALRWSRAWLGLESADPGSFRRVQAARPASAADGERDADGKRAKARAMWLGARPILGTPAEAYLAGRGIRLAELGRAPSALRFDPACWCAEASRPLPAMLAAIVRDGQHVATHRTYLAQRGAGWTKAALDAPKKVLGRMAGGFIPLARGLSGKPISAAPGDDTVALAEGIEDALTVALHTPEWRVLAAVSLGNMGDLVLPEQLADLVLVFDRDGENAQARQARLRAARRFLEAGRSVREVRPPEGFKDMNVWHQAMEAAQRSGVA